MSKTICLSACFVLLNALVVDADFCREIPENTICKCENRKRESNCIYSWILYYFLFDINLERFTR